MGLKEIAARVAGRKQAAEILDLLEYDKDTKQQFGGAFLDEIHQHLIGKQPEEKPNPANIEPIGRLGATIMRFGEFSGMPFDNVPMERLDWYLRTAEENVKVLRAYLTHPEIESRRGTALAD